MKQLSTTPLLRTCVFVLCAVAVCTIPEFAFAQGSPFETGATNLQQALITIATPIAVILVMALGIAAASGRISWGWPIGVIIGIGLVFAANPIVTWIKSLFPAG
jgi:type IV secretion system protein VirB2